MRKASIILLVIVCLCACEEADETFNYIQVTVTGNVSVVQYIDDHAYDLDKPIAGEPINMMLIKAGGERLEETGTTGTGGKTSITTVFNLYKEQPIEFFATPVNHPEQARSGKLTWELADELAGGSGHSSELRTLNYEIYIVVGIP